MRAIFSLLVLLSVLSTTWAERITGEVRAADGRQVAGVQLYRYDSKTERWRPLSADRRGHFSLTVAEEDGDIPHCGQIVAWAEGFGLTGAFLQRTGNVIMLPSATRLSGRMIDVHGRPIAGMRIRLTGFGGWSPEYFAVPDKLADRFSTTTDDDGHWAIGGAPPHGSAFLQAAKDGYLPKRLQTNLNSPNAADVPAIALPAGIFRGRVVDERGKPVKGAHVVAVKLHYYPSESSQTLADGSYVIGSLPAGTYYVMVYDPSLKRVGMALTGQVLAAGQDKALPDLVLIPGAFVEGTVTETGTGKPVAGQIVGCRDGQHPFYERYEGPVDYNPFPDVFRTRRPTVWDAVTDKKGHFRFIVAPGEGFLSLPVVPRRYLAHDYRNCRFEVKAGETAMQNFMLDTGCTLRGTAVDGRGKPLAGVWLVVQTKTYDLPAGTMVYSGPIDFSRDVYAGEPVRTNSKGEFVITGLPERECELLTTGYDAPAAWRPAAPVKVTLPVKQPVRLVLEKITVQSFSGRVVTADGAPLAGVKVGCFLSYPMGRYEFIGTEHHSQTDRQGWYTMANVPVDAEAVINTAELPGYRRRSGGKVARKDGRLIAEDVVLEPVPAAVTGAFSGRVIGADGKPAPGVTLLALQDESRQWAKADPDGRFSFTGVVQREATIIAAGGLQWGQAVASVDGGPITLRLRESSPQPAPDARRAFTMLRDIQLKKPNFFLDAYLPATLAAADPELAMTLVNEDARHTNKDRMLLLLIATLAKADPVKAAAWAPGKLAEIKDPATRAETAVNLAVAIINCDEKGAAALYAQGERFTPTGDAAPVYYARLAALAWQLKNGEEAQWLAKAFDKPEHSSLGDWVETSVAGALARTSPPLLKNMPRGYPWRQGAVTKQILLNLPDEESALAQQYMTPMPRNNLISQFLALGDVPSEPDTSLICIAIRKWGKTNPAWALELASQVTGERAIGPALAYAAVCQDPATAAALYREAASSQNLVREATEIAQAATAVDPALSRQLLAMVYPVAMNYSGPHRDEILPLIRAYHACDPAVSRLLIEAEYYQYLQAGNPNSDMLCDIALAMAAVDFDRALAIVAAAPDSDSPFDKKGVASLRLAQFLLAPPSLRETMPLDYVHMDDRPGWLPGDQQVW